MIQLSGIALVYGACLLLGFIYSAMQFFFGAHHGVDTGGHGVDIGHHGMDLGHIGHHGPVHVDTGGHAHAGALEDGTAPQTVSFVNPLTLGTWVTTFGGFGLIFLAVLNSVILSLIASGVTSFLATLLAFYIFLHVLIQPEVVRNMTPDETVGMKANVTVSIPAGGGSMGQIGYILDAKRFSANAQTEDGSEIPAGASVRIVAVRGRTAVVRRLDNAGPATASQEAPADSQEESQP